MNLRKPPQTRLRRATLSASAVEECERHLLAMMEQSKSLLVLTDRDSQVLFMTGGLGGVVAKRLRIAVGQPIDRYFTEESQWIATEAVGYLTPGVPSPPLPLTVDLDGQEYHLECTVVDRSSESVMSGLLWTITDTTARYRAEEELREAHTRTSEILRTLNVAVWSVTSDKTGPLFLSDGHAKIYARPASDFFENPNLWREVIHPDDVDAAIQKIDRQIEAKDEATVEYRILRPDGSVRWIESRICPVRDNAGRLLRFNGSAVDITEMKLERLARQESEERYNRIVRKVPGIVYQFRRNPDGSTSFPFISARAEEIVGYTAEQIAENADLLLSAIHEDDIVSMYAAMQESAATLGEFVWEGRVYIGNGGYRWFKVNSNPEHCEDGSVLWDGIIFDVTAIKEVEQSAREKEAAEQANAAKSEFLSRMSHELRTPLNAILGFGQLLEIQVEDENYLDMIRHLNRAGQHLLALINEVLDISRIESRNLHVSCEPVDCGQLIEEVCSLLSPLATEKRVQVNVERPPEPLYANADAQRLRQILLNLLANAIKYNWDGGAVTLSAKAAPGRRVEFRVKDNGPGIPKHRRSRLFTAFDRLGAESTGVEGTGLGLALSKRLAEVMGGSIRMEDAEGGGCLFIVTLDVAEGRHVDALFEVSTEPPLSVSRTVLYIEDNFASTRLMENLASHVGARLHVTALGRLGYESAKSMQPDFVFLDLDLPDLDGMEVLRLLKSNEETKDIPVFIVSADSTMARREKALQNGAAGYLSKPFEVSEVISLLRTDPTKRGTAA
ncbi:MAG TPA: PAS domain-containing protein [Fimbriimonadaceae bacterium]|nr:PAS domain-containing protein [Fimbriimonadaceae bacterium]